MTLLPARHSPSPEFELLLQDAMAGSREALGEALECFRKVLIHEARKLHKEHLQGKLGDSDLVEDTLLEAVRDFKDFRGKTSLEFVAWLVKILIRNSKDLRCFYWDREKRNPAAEVSLDDLGQGSQHRHELATHDLDAGTTAIRREEVELMAKALSELPEDYREVIQLRSYEDLQFEDIGCRLGRSADAARHLWVRATQELKLRVHELGLRARTGNRNLDHPHRHSG